MIKRVRKISKFWLALLLSVPFLATTACTAAFLSAANYGVFQNTDVNLAERNFAAADYLIQQADTFVRKKHLIKAMALNNVKDPTMSSVFGKIVPEQVGVRLSQLGYQMDLETVATGSDTVYLRPGNAEKHAPPDFILSGTYLEQSSDIEVNLRLTNVKTNRIAAAFNYRLPYTRSISELTEKDDDKPRAFRLIEAP